YNWDEAHQVVQAAVSQYEKTFVYTQWKYIFGQLGTYDDQQLFYELYQAAEASGFSNVPEMLHLEALFNKFTAIFDELALSLTAAFQNRFQGSRHKKCASLLAELPYEKDRFMDMLRFLNEWIDLSQLILQKAERLTETSIQDRLTITDWRYWTEELMVKAVEFSEIFVFPLEDEVSWIEGDLR